MYPTSRLIAPVSLSTSWPRHVPLPESGPSSPDLERAADLDGGERRLGNIEARLHVARRQDRHDGPPARHPFADDEERVLHQPRHRRGDALLLELPRGLGELRLRRLHVRLSRFALGVAPHRLERILELGLGFLHARYVAAVGTARLVELRARGVAGLYQLLLPRELQPRELGRRLRLVHLLARRCDLRPPARHLQVLEPRLRVLQALLGLRTRRALRLLLQREHRLASLDLLAAPHGELLQLARIRRGEHHVLALDVALPHAFLVLVARREQRERQKEEAPHCFPLAMHAAAFFNTALASARASALSRASCSTAQPITTEWKNATLCGSVASPLSPSAGAMICRSSPMNLRSCRLIAGCRSAAVTSPSITRTMRLSAEPAAMPVAPCDGLCTRACASCRASRSIE